MAGLPKTKFSEINGRFNQFLEDFSNSLIVNEFAYRRLESEYKQLLVLPEFEARARIRLGHLYSFKMDEFNFRHHFERARQLEGKTSEWKLPYISAALNFGFFHEAKREIDSEWDLSDPSLIRTLRSILITSGLFVSAAKLTRKLQDMQLDARHVNRLSRMSDTLYDEIFCAEEIIVQSGVTESFVMKSINIGSKVVVERIGKPLHRYGISVTSGECIQYSFVVDEPVEVLAELDWLIAEELVDALDDPRSDIISVVTRPLGD
jgi:hypothetical protein